MRNLKRSDLQQIERILRALGKKGSFTAEEIDCALELLQIVIDQPQQKDYLVLVAENHDQVIGYVLYGPVPLTDGNYDLYWIATDPERHGSGFGRRLLQAVERDMQKRGARMVCLETSSKTSYERTRHFYDQAGYRQESVIADFYAPGDDRITYVKRFA